MNEANRLEDITGQPETVEQEMAPRMLTGHKVNPTNDVLDIAITDAPGAGGANHRYEITGLDTASNPSRFDANGYAMSFTRHVILFQNGPIKDAGVNGLTHEVLLEILVDRLRAFQRGPYACIENGRALTMIEAAQHWLHVRTRNRMSQGIEGTHAIGAPSPQNVGHAAPDAEMPLASEQHENGDGR